MPLSALSYSLKRVSVHDPSIVWEPASQTYYIFGSHRAVAKTKDLMSWTAINTGNEQMGNGYTDYRGVPWQTSTNSNAYSKDAFTTPVVTKVTKGGKEVDLPYFNPLAWAKRGSSSYDISGNLWAPDVIYNKAMNKWCMYMSVNGDFWYSSIVLLTADNIEGPYR